MGRTRLISTGHFIQIRQEHTFAFGVDAFTGHPVQTQYHVLRRNDDWLTVSRRQYVVGCHHQRAGFQLRFDSQRYVYRHLVTVEVSVISRTHQWVQLNRFTFDQLRFERLNTQTVQCWCTVQHDRVFADNISQNVPDFCGFALNHFLCSFNGCRQTTVFQFAEDKRLEQFQSHLLRQTTLMQTQLWTHGNYRTARVVNTFTQQVLTETTLLTLDHVCQRFQRTLVGASDGAATTTVIQQSIDRFLQHTLFVAYDDVRSVQLQQALQTVVTVDHTTVQIVQIRSRKTATIQRYQRTQIRWQYWQYRHDHPLRIVTGVVESFQQLQTLGQLFDLGFRAGCRNFFTQTLNFFAQFDLAEQRLNGFRTHFGFEFVAKLFNRFIVLFVAQQLTNVERGHARLSHYE